MNHHDSDFDDSDNKMSLGKASGTQKVLNVDGDDSTPAATDDEDDDGNNEEDEDDNDDEEMSEEDTAREVFGELLPTGSATLPLADFLAWEDVQELVASGAISKDDLALAIEQSGVATEQLDEAKLDFDAFFGTLMQANAIMNHVY
jgi:NACalpha-BTF3-like transcription factor